MLAVLTPTELSALAVLCVCFFDYTFGLSDRRDPSGTQSICPTYWHALFARRLVSHKELDRALGRGRATESRIAYRHIDHGSDFYFSQNVPSLWARLYVLSIGTGFVMLLPIAAALRARRPKDWLDQVLLAVSLVFTVFTLIRPLFISLFKFKDPAEYTDSVYWLLSSMSVLLFALIFTVVTVLIAIKGTVTKLRHERDHDVLTRALNRRAFHESARRVIGDKRRHPIAVLSCDIDHFKHINDTWGHDQGDRTLQAVSLCLQRNVRDHDLVARMGGEEFVLLLTRIDLQGAERVAERIQNELKSDRSVLPSGSTLTLSFGITAITHEEHIAHALKEADELLYSAKNAGRDRVHVTGKIYPDISFENTRPLGPVSHAQAGS